MYSYQWVIKVEVYFHPDIESRLPPFHKMSSLADISHGLLETKLQDKKEYQMNKKIFQDGIKKYYLPYARAFFM